MSWHFSIQFGSERVEWRNDYKPTDEEILRAVHALYAMEYAYNPNHIGFIYDRERVRQAMSDKSPEVPDDDWKAALEA